MKNFFKFILPLFITIIIVIFYAYKPFEKNDDSYVFTNISFNDKFLVVGLQTSVNFKILQRGFLIKNNNYENIGFIDFNKLNIIDFITTRKILHDDNLYIIYSGSKLNKNIRITSGIYKCNLINFICNNFYTSTDKYITNFFYDNNDTYISHYKKNENTIFSKILNNKLIYVHDFAKDYCSNGFKYTANERYEKSHFYIHIDTHNINCNFPSGNTSTLLKIKNLESKEIYFPKYVKIKNKGFNNDILFGGFLSYQYFPDNEHLFVSSVNIKDKFYSIVDICSNFISDENTCKNFKLPGDYHISTFNKKDNEYTFYINNKKYIEKYKYDGVNKNLLLLGIKNTDLPLTYTHNFSTEL